MPKPPINDPDHWSGRAAQMRALAALADTMTDIETRLSCSGWPPTTTSSPIGPHGCQR
jgi:hypothetical protein